MAAGIGWLIEALHHRTGHVFPVEYGEGPVNHPSLDASAARALGLEFDGDMDALFVAVVSRIERGKSL